MALASSAKIRILTENLRIRYAQDIAGLRKLFAEVSAGATRFVEITGNSYEGGSASGQLILERLEYLDAVQRMLRELDPDGTPSAPPTSTFADFRGGWVQT